MNIQQLKCFSTVAQLQNFSRAADFLHVSQSALSKQIASLEAELGVSLFDRKGKRIFLNKAGMRFYDASSVMLQELRSAEDDVKLLGSGQNHRIRIGASGIPDMFLKCMNDFADRHPETEFIINNLIEFDPHLNINDFDLLICPDEIRYEKLSGFHLYDENYLYALSAGSRYASEKIFSTDMLAAQPVIFMRGSMLLPEYPFRICSALQVSIPTTYFTDTRGTHQRFIASGMASGFVSVSESETYRADRNIRLLKILDSRFTRPHKICFLRDKHLSDIGALFRDHVVSSLGLQGG